MRTTLDIDDQLLKEAKSILKIKTTKEIVNFALSELIKSRKRKKIISMFGKAKWSGDINEMREI